VAGSSVTGDVRDYRDAVPFPLSIEAVTIGRVDSEFSERFGTPRPPRARGPRQEGNFSGKAGIELLRNGVQVEALRDLEGFGYIWLISWFHLNRPRLKPLVSPPRGDPSAVYSRLAPRRPNPIGLSCVRLLKIEGRTLFVDDLNLIDGTPILDIKPYIPD
jgi:tRNA-Thr(GGU) m(6)t(6)A37 methyltransferase TsaA